MMLVPFSIRIDHSPSRRPDDAVPIGALLERFSGRMRGRVAAFAAISARHADLLTSFPAAALAIIGRPASDGTRAEAMTLVADGEPLAAIASVLGLPLWMRKLPPEAFSQPLPQAFGAPVYDPAFASRIVTTCPPSSGRPDRWLQTVLEACAHGDGELAQWLGSKRLFACRRVPALPVLPLVFYAWFSRHPEQPAAKLMFRPFDPKLGLGRAAMITRHWLMRVLQDLCLASETEPTPWTQIARIGDIEVVPLSTSGAIIDEGTVMGSCVGTYVVCVVAGDCRLYSIRDGDLRLATMEVRACESGGLPCIVQLKGPRNAPVSEAVSEVAADWLLSRLKIRGSHSAFRSGQHCDKAFQTAIWEPFAGRSRSEGGSARSQKVPSVAEIMTMLAALKGFERM